MKRPPGLWLLLTTVLVWLCIEEVYCIKATSLIFGKTTTTTTAAPESEDAEGGAVESTATSNNETEDAQSGQNTTHKLTGIPQIDYIYDPNLPRELNGYNLSEYPFYHRVPEDIVFKCDGLHDGFYASVPHKCQVYHHCLFGTRYDFLCANYTAFDQKTFICHFVSEVDCVNSKKFWHRNDALYQAASTTTAKPIVIQTPPPTSATPVPIVPLLQRRPLTAGGRRRRPQRRRRPEYEYYDYEEEDDEFYDEPRRRKRPRYRPRPIYDDEYDDDYEEDSYDRRRRPYNRRRNNNERRRYEDEDYQEEDDRKKRPNKRPSTKRRPADDEDDYEARSHDRPRKGGQRRPADDDYEDENPPKEDRRSHDRPRKNQDQEDARPRDRPKQNDEDTRRRPHDRYDEGRRGYDRPRKNNNQDESRKFDRPRKGGDDNYEDKLDEPPMIKPVSGSSVYGKPRAPPRIRPPVPKNEQNKFSYKSASMKTSTTKAPVDEEYYEDYEEEELPKNNKKPEGVTSTTDNSKIDTKEPELEESVSESKDVADKKEPKEDVRNFRDNRKPQGTRRGQPSRRPPQDDDYIEDEVTRRPYKALNSNSPRRRPEAAESKSPPPPDEERGESTTTITNRERPEPVIKVLKRPFLPSRGGNPYLPRGLQAVGAKAVNNATEDDPELQKMTESRKLEDTKAISEAPPQEPRVKIIKTNREGSVVKQTEAPPLIEDEEEEVKPFKPSPIVVKIPVRNKYLTTSDEEFRPTSNRGGGGGRQNVRAKEAEARITEKPQINPLDIDENEYDVTLNDALNPTLPNLPVRGFPTGFSAPNDYTYNAYQRSRYVVDPTLNQASSDYVYTIKQPVQNYNSGGNQFESTLRYNAPTTYQHFRSSPQVTHAQAQPFYASY